MGLFLLSVKSLLINSAPPSAHFGLLGNPLNAFFKFKAKNHDTYGSADQTQKLLIKSQRRTWSIFAEAFEAEARDFGLSCPRYTLAAIIQWHLTYEGPKLNHEFEDLSQDPSILCLDSTELSPAHVQSAAPPAPT